MSETEMMKIPHLKTGAVVEMKIGGAFVAKLNEVIAYLIDGHDEELAALKSLNSSSYKDNLTPWGNAVVTMSTLVQEIMKTAEANGQVEYKSMTEITPNVPGED